MNKLLKTNLDKCRELPQFYLGQLVRTPHGDGMIVKIEMDFNGLYVSQETSKVVVWYSTETTNGWVSHQYRLKEINTIRESSLDKLGI